MRDLWPSCDLSLQCPKTKSWPDTKWPWIPQMASYPKYKDALFSPTLKMEENEVPLFFGFEVK